MHKKITLTIVIGFSLIILAMTGCRTTRPTATLHQPYQPADAKQMNLHGPVKSITSRYYKAQTTSKDSIAKGRYILKSVYTFDQRGNKLSEATYNPDGTKDLNYQYQYDKAGRLIDEEKKQVGKSYHEHFAYSYDKDGRLKKKRTLFPDTARTLYSYEDNGQQIIQKSYDAEGDFYFKQVQEYEDGYLTETKSYSSIHSDSDQENQLILNNHHAYRYDRSGNRIEEREFTPSGKLDGIATYSYDDTGNVIKKTYQYGNEDAKVLFKNRYEYSDRQNWIQKIEFAKGTPQTITERKITYFE